MRSFLAGALLLFGICGFCYIGTKLIALEAITVAILVVSALLTLVAGILAGGASSNTVIKELQAKLQDAHKTFDARVAQVREEYKAAQVAA